MIYLWFEILDHAQITRQSFFQITGMFEEHFHIFSAFFRNVPIDFCLTLFKFESWLTDYCDIRLTGKEL